jgi:hypothetical protein
MNGDRKPDVVVAGRRGTYVLINGVPTSTRLMAGDSPFLRSRGGLSVLRTQGAPDGRTLVLRVLQPGFHHALGFIDAAGREQVFALGTRRAGEIFPLDIGRLPAGNYQLRAVRDGQPQTLGSFAIPR